MENNYQQRIRELAEEMAGEKYKRSFNLYKKYSKKDKLSWSEDFYIKNWSKLVDEFISAARISVKHMAEVIRQRDEAIRLLIEFKQKIALPPPAISAIDHILKQYKKDGKCYSSSEKCVNSNVCQGLDHCMYHSGLPSQMMTLERGLIAPPENNENGK